MSLPAGSGNGVMARTPEEELFHRLKFYVIPILKLDQLKTLLRFLNVKTTGNKSHLVDRLSVYLDTHRTNLRRLEDLRNEASRLLNAPRAPQPLARPLQQQRPQPQGVPIIRLNPPAPPPGASSSATPGGLPIRSMFDHHKFKISPYFEVIDRVAPPKIGDCRHSTVPFRIDFILSADVISRLQSPVGQKVSDYLLYLFVGPADLPSSSAADPSTANIPFEYPPSALVYCNMQLLQGKHIGYKKKANTAMPADITRLINLNSWNKVEIRHNAAEKRYLALVQLVKKVPISDIVAKIRVTKFVTKEQVLNSRKQEQSGDDDDVIATTDTVNLKDPVSRFRIGVPTRSIACKHVQCFDAETYYRMNETLPTWTCPVCSRVLQQDEIICDGFFQDILDNTTESDDAVEVQPNGQWVVKAEGDKGSSPSDSEGVARKEVKTPKAIMVDDSNDETASQGPININERVRPLPTTFQPIPTHRPASASHSSPSRLTTTITSAHSIAPPTGTIYPNHIQNENMQHRMAPLLPRSTVPGFVACQPVPSWIASVGGNMIQPQPTISNQQQSTPPNDTTQRFRSQMVAPSPSSRLPISTAVPNKVVEVIDLTLSDDEDDAAPPLPSAAGTSLTATQPTSTATVSHPTIFSNATSTPAPPPTFQQFLKRNYHSSSSDTTWNSSNYALTDLPRVVSAHHSSSWRRDPSEWGRYNESNGSARSIGDTSGADDDRLRESTAWRDEPQAISDSEDRRRRYEDDGPSSVYNNKRKEPEEGFASVWHAKRAHSRDSGSG
ncbi:hypothetical protein SeLEV6574_g04022 [Synchytrium endobioticum]|uniref:SP-RING-type domain-containing protein n=1 Tax=Synchytrium endobioticum TaxID=286115 RepID=A0A507D165_9FUNG|nr:hypothetical protein SeLEV6574_g04022 [Synchytrium endobioticum]